MQVGDRQRRLETVKSKEETTELQEAHAELDKQGAQPGLTVQGRIRAFVRDGRVRDVPVRQRLPDDRLGFVRKIHVGSSKVYLQAGEYPGPGKRLGELFLRLDECDPVVHGVTGDDVAKLHEKITQLVDQVTDLSVSVSRLLDAVAIAVSIGLQYGIPIDVFCDKLERTRFEPSGPTKDAQIGIASSPLDAVFRFLRARYGTR